jgi:DNA repair protein RecN (Recombination protein N)
MLVELTITNFAIIDTLRLTLEPEFNVFTGETGAGKSIILDAVSALVGGRIGAEMVRAGADKAVIEGLFDVSGALSAAAKERAEALPPESGRDEDGDHEEEETIAGILAVYGIEADEGVLILTREIGANGRGVARVAGRAVPVAVLQRLATHLVDIHGQGDHLTLLRPAQHLFFLDRYANTVELRGEVSGLVSDLRVAQRDLARLEKNDQELERRLDLLRFQVDEIAAARLTPGELDSLEQERRRLSSVERLAELASMAHAALAGDETGESTGAVALLAAAQRALGDLLRLDTTLATEADSLAQAAALAEDVSASLRAYQDELVVDPGRQVEIEERWDLLMRLRRKYGATIEEILAYADSAAEELSTFSRREERLSELRDHETALLARIGAKTSVLSARRQQAARRLAESMERELDQLNMRKARFEIAITQAPDPDGAPVAGVTRARSTSPAVSAGRYAFTSTGIDTVEFRIAPNPGEPFKPLARIASGGETSRLMLALRTVLARADAVPVLIFDEIDAGISGKSGQAVGEKLWELARSHQILCVTHLPQIAAFGDAHFSVAKEVDDLRTRTVATRLTGEQRIDELSLLLGARSTAARANASELLERAGEWKSSHARESLRA